MTELIEKELVYTIVGCSMEVHNEIGYGLREKTYERSLCREFKLRNIWFDQQAVYPVLYKGEKVDEYIPDLVVRERVVIDAKTVDAINDDHRGQVLNYLKITGLKVGLIINFKNPKLEWERVVLDTAR
ncbi:MAG TPA: GxxExxY protein [Tichowtungia sp.]|nr:GxxExxY protein [Tichowtungia sp.]